MKRNTFLKRVSLSAGGALLLPSVSLLQGCEYKPRVRTALTEGDIPFLDEIGDTLLPPTETSPGAKASNIGGYMMVMYADCLAPESQAVFLNGLNEVDARSSQKFSTSFEQAQPEQRLQLMQTIHEEARAYRLKMAVGETRLPHYFDLFKRMTLSGYFSSEIGMTQARNYLPLPGRFEACIPYRKGSKPWAS